LLHFKVLSEAFSMKKEEAHIRLPLSVFNYFSCIQMAISRIFDLLAVNLNYQP